MPSKKRPQRTSGGRRPTAAEAIQASADVAAQARAGFSIVGIGASAGGLEALDELFAGMPESTGVAFVVVTHQHPGHTSLLPELLGKITAIPVIEAADGMRVEPNHIYIGPPGGRLAILHGTLHRMESGGTESPHLPIDSFFRSLAEDQKEKAACIVLSGMGTDGTLGLKAIKGESGLVMVQHLGSAKYTGMPGSAVATGLADYILPCAEMPAQILAYVRGPYLGTVHPEEDPEPLGKVLVLLRSRVGHDFSGYKPSTIRRRVERRMNLLQLERPADYVRYLQRNPGELDSLFKELLISVTSFFRDPEACEALARTALPTLLETRRDNRPLRIWVPGCATGEEVFSLAILLREALEASRKPCQVQLFGTDLNSDAIAIARQGQYPEGIAVDVAPERLERFFTRANSAYRVRREVREMAIFAVQNVIKDPPFTKLELISCRNVLIYLNAELQKRLLPIFHYALKPGGLLFLGPSESVGSGHDLFDVVDKKWKIFRRRESVFPPPLAMTFPAQPVKLDFEPRAATGEAPPREASLPNVVERLLLARFAPASVVVNDRGDVVYIHGRTGAFLEPAAGHPRLNVLAMAREGLALELGAALRQAAAGPAEVRLENVRVQTNGHFVFIDLTVAPLTEPEAVRGFFLVTFQPRAIPAAEVKSRARRRKEPASGRIEELERALLQTRESLQTSIEELQTSNEELKSTNEELQSANEELQSTNEELETSKEEMQSLNEELITINTELRSKVEDLSRANDDMQNLLNSTEIATLFLDNELRIKRYTEQARRLISLIPGDLGRPVGDLTSSLTYDRLVTDCGEVLRTLVFKQAEVRTRDGHWYLMRIMPYRTAENAIEGLVLTFVDINPVKAAEKSLFRMSKVFLDGPEPMFLLDLTGRIAALNDEAARTYGWSRQELLGQPIQMTMPREAASTVEGWLRDCLAGQRVRAPACTCVNKSGQLMHGSLTLAPLTDDRGQPDAICMLAKDLQV